MAGREYPPIVLASGPYVAQAFCECWLCTHGSTGSARRCCDYCRRHAGYCVQDPERCDLGDLVQASLLRNLHRRLLRRSLVLAVVSKATNDDAAAERGGEKQQCGTQRRAQPADPLVIVSCGQRRAGATDQ